MRRSGHWAATRQTSLIPSKGLPFRPALCPPTLATKSQKPRPERWPLTDPSLPPCAALPTQPANGRRLVASLCATQPARGRRLVADLLLLAFEADRSRVAFFLRRSPRGIDQGQRARLPEQSFGLQAAPSSEYRVEIAAALASTMAQCLLKVVTAARRPLAKPKRVRPPQCSAVKLWAQASAAANFTRQTLLRRNLLQLQRSASASD